MLLRSFKSGQPLLLFLIPVLAVLMWLKYIILPQPVQMSFEPYPMPFYHWLSSLLINQLIIGKIITLGIHVFIALWIPRMNTKFILLQQRTYLPAIIYLIVVSSYLPLQQLNPAVFACLFLVFSVEIMITAYRKEGLAHEFFMAAFLISLASLFYARAMFLMLVVWTGLSLFRSFQWREWVFTFLGFATPYVFLFAGYYLAGQDLLQHWEDIRRNFIHDRGTGNLGLYYIIFYAYLFLLILLASRKMLMTYQGLKIFIRKFFRLNFWIFTFVVAVWLIIYNRDIEMLLFIAVPVSYILTYFFLNIRYKLAGEIIFSLLCAGYIMLLVFN